MVGIVIAVAFIIVGVPFYLEKVKPNVWAGFRVRKTLSNPAIWYAANRVMGIDFIIGGVVLLIFSIILLIMRVANPAVDVHRLDLVAAGVCISVVVIHCFWRLSRM